MPYDLGRPGRWDVNDLSNMHAGESLEAYRVRCQAAARFWFDQDRERGFCGRAARGSLAPAPGAPQGKRRGRAPVLPPAPPAAEVVRLPGEGLPEFRARRARLAVQRHREKMRALTSSEVSAHTPSEGQPADGLPGEGKPSPDVTVVTNGNSRNDEVSAHSGVHPYTSVPVKTSEDRPFLVSGAGACVSGFGKTSEDRPFSNPAGAAETFREEVSGAAKTSEDQRLSVWSLDRTIFWLASHDDPNGATPNQIRDWMQRVISDVREFALHEGYSPEHVERILLHIFRA